MGILRAVLSISFILVVIPVVIGSGWTRKMIIKSVGEKAVCSHMMGFFTMLAVWQLLVVPLAFLRVRYIVICGIYAGILLIISGISVKWLYISNVFHSVCVHESNNNMTRKQKESQFSFVYKTVFLALLLLQVYFAVFYSRTYMSDDGYAVFSAMAIEDGYILMSDPSTGIAQSFTAQWVQRLVQTELYFPGFISLISGIDAAAVCHTVLYAFVTLAGYEVYYLIAFDIFKHDEDRWLFLMFVSLLYIFGYHSHYSLTFRMLGPNDEGKAILAVVMTPFILWLMRRMLQEGYSRGTCLQLMMLSLAAVSLTLGGVYTFAALLGTMVLLGLFVKKDPRILLLGVCGGIFPMIYGAMYAFMLLS